MDVLDLRFVSLIGAAGVSVLLDVVDSSCQIVASKVVENVLTALGAIDALDVSRPVRSPSLEHALFGIAVYDSALRFVYVNPAMACINGLAPESHLGLRPGDLFDFEPGSNDVESMLAHVLTTRDERDVLVSGSTASGQVGNWLCRVRAGSYVVGAVNCDCVVAIVTPHGSAGNRTSHRAAFPLVV